MQNYNLFNYILTFKITQEKPRDITLASIAPHKSRFLFPVFPHKSRFFIPVFQHKSRFSAHVSIIQAPIILFNIPNIFQLFSFSEEDTA